MLWALIAERPCHLLIETAGSGGMHAYWRLDQPLAAHRVDRKTGDTVEPIERANLRLIHHLGCDPDGKPTVADPACKERARVLRPLSVGRTVTVDVSPARSFADASVTNRGGWRWTS